MARVAASLGANTFQFFTRNPRGGQAKPIDPKDIATFEEVCAEAGIKKFLAHAPYTLNFCAEKDSIRKFAIETLADDMCRMENTPGQMYNIHPGSHVGQGAEVGIEKIADAINQVLNESQSTMLLLETMAGKGSEVGRTFEEIQAIIERVELQDHIGVCMDTCHIWEGGYDIVGDLEDVLEHFDKVIGLDRLHAIHMNDSKNPREAHKDRHEAIGLGHIGFEALSAITNHPALKDLPFFLETPHDKIEEYADEISALRNAYKY